MAKYKQPLYQLMERSALAWPVKRRTRDHVAQEYAAKGDWASAHDLCRNLTHKAKKGVLGAKSH